MNRPKRSSFKSVLKVYTLSKILLWVKPSYFSLENGCYSWCMHQTGLFSSASVVPHSRELKIETFSGRRQLQPDVTSSFVRYCACSCSPPCRRGPVGNVKLVCLALWRKREYLTFISIRFVAFSNQHFADYRS